MTLNLDSIGARRIRNPGTFIRNFREHAKHARANLFLYQTHARREPPRHELPRIFEIALSNWYFLPAEAVMVGDNLDADVGGAKTAGLYAIWLTRRAGRRAGTEMTVQPDASLSALWELPAFLDRLQVQ